MIIDTFRLINLVVAISAIYPSYYLIRTLIKERRELVPGGKKQINMILTFVFITIATSAFVNAIFTIYVFLFNNPNNHAIIGLSRTLIIEAGLSTVSWLFYIFVKRV